MKLASSLKMHLQSKLDKLVALEIHSLFILICRQLLPGTVFDEDFWTYSLSSQKLPIGLKFQKVVPRSNVTRRIILNLRLRYSSVQENMTKFSKSVFFFQFLGYSADEWLEN